jgi:hypothetical protein
VARERRILLVWSCKFERSILIEVTLAQSSQRCSTSMHLPVNIAVVQPQVVLLDAKSLADSQGLDPSICDQELSTLAIPKQPSADFAQQLQQALLRSSWHSSGIAAASQVAPATLVHTIVSRVIAICSKEPTLLELAPSAQQHRVTVVGDTHGA